MAGLHMGLGYPFKQNERGNSFGHAHANGEQAVIAQNHRSVAGESGSDPFASIGRLHLNFFVVEQGMVVEENAGLLCDWLEQPGFGRERRAVLRVHVGSRHDLGSCVVDRCVDVVGGDVDAAVTVDDGSVVAQCSDGRRSEVGKL